MPTTLFAQQHHPPFGPGGDDCDVHYIHSSNALYIISEHEYVRSLIPSAQRADRLVKTRPIRTSSRRIQSPERTQTQGKAPRPLMTSLTHRQDASMAAVAAPGSPPDLTNSKSSKSSSFHSTNLSDIMGPSSDLSHFEDINLDDVQGALGPSSFPMPLSPSNRLVFEAPRASLSTRSMSQGHAPVHSFRDLTAGSKLRHPSLKGQVNTAVGQQSQLNAPSRSMRRGFTSPSAPSLANITNLAAPQRQSRSRSPSPSNPQSFPSAPRSLSRKSSRNLEVSPNNGINSRRQSWQHAPRKTVKEREAECDDEDDDDLPDDYAIWNVPLSPRPMQERSPGNSACNSPPTRSPSPSVSRSTSQRRRSTSLKSSPSVASNQFSQPPSPNPEKENVPPEPLGRQRTKSWNDTFMTLDEDGRKLTEALEEYQAAVEKEQEFKRQQPRLSRESVEQQKAKSSKQALPPVRKSDPLIDPLQPSLEKEKYLSRTRPSWLPPKDPKEEAKHLREYAKMVARMEGEQKKLAEKEEEEKLAREKVGRKKADLWENILLPKFATEVATPAGRQTYRQLWWSGIPAKSRGAVWKIAIGNELGISETTFKVALEKAQAQIVELGDKALDGKAAIIVENTTQVFPDLGVFAPKSEDREEQPYHQDLVNVCLAYASYRPDVDTTYGIHHIAGLFLLNMSPTDAFITLGNLLNRPLPLSLLVRDQTAMTAAYNTVLHALSKKAQSLAKRLEELRVEPRDYLLPSLSSLFCDRLPIEHAARLMDVYAIEGDKIPPRAAVGLISIREGRLYQGGVDEILSNLNSTEMKLHPDDFMAKVYEAGKSSS